VCIISLSRKNTSFPFQNIHHFINTEFEKERDDLLDLLFPPFPFLLFELLLELRELLKLVVSVAEEREERDTSSFSSLASRSVAILKQVRQIVFGFSNPKQGGKLTPFTIHSLQKTRLHKAHPC